MKLFLATFFLSFTLSLAFNRSTECGRRPFCQAYPGFCKQFAEKLLDGFRAKELPWTARISVTERSTNQTKECIGILLSKRDIVVDGGCFSLPTNRSRPNSTSSHSGHKSTTTAYHFDSRCHHSSKERTTTDGAYEHTISPYRCGDHNITAVIGNSSYRNLTFEPVDGAILLILNEDETIDGFSEDLQPSCIGTYDDEQIDIEGVVCGFNKQSRRFKKWRPRTEFSCKALKFSIGSNAQTNHTNERDELLKDLVEGAVLFQTIQDAWYFAGFTNFSNNSMTNFTAADCDAIEEKTEGRVQCSQLPKWDWEPSEPVPVPTSDASNSGSPVIPFVVLGSIIILGLVLIGHCVMNFRNRTAYATI